MGEQIRGLVLRLRDRVRRCSLCGTQIQKAAARYGSYRFCSVDHKFEWHYSCVL
ncbi:hypothetical protein [Glaciibacter sp. 2TAF33]|uniref:hypothetical protein n=1 Tax=Glaciibacter sp. 2TAF33 TaxID=3233015 RepID=UPI003F906419